MNIWLKSIPVGGLMALMLVTAAAAEPFEDGVTALGRADYAGALHIFSEAAGQGDYRSQFALAEMYRQGQGVRQDYQQALGWYRKAADQGNPGAQFNLAILYQTGRGVRRDDHLAANWCAKAAAQGYASAQVELGVLYAEGRGVPRSDQTAVDWFEKAAAQGDADGLLHLAAMPRNLVAGASRERFHAMMDRLFGAGRWRETGGYRSQAKENELRRQGAGTVRAGERSAHSLGSPDAPGAYDIVVAGMSPQQAVAKLKRSNQPLAKVVAEAAHGTQGPHLHVEPLLTRASVSTPKSARRGSRQLQTVSDPPGQLLAVVTTSPAPRD